MTADNLTSSAVPAGPTSLRLKPHDTVDLFEVTHATPTRLRLASGMSAALILLALAALTILFDLYLLKAGFNARVIRIFPKIIQVILVFMPVIAIAGLFFVGRSYDVDAANNRIEARRMYFLRTTHPADQVASIVLDLTTPGRSTLLTLRLKDQQDRELICLFFTALDGPDWPNVLHAAADISQILHRPLRITGDAKEATPSATAALDHIRQTGQPPDEMRAYG